MKINRPVRFFFCTISVALSFLTERAVATEVWTGPTITFTKPNGADWTQPANQDRITPNVWITRDTTRGIFNAKTESSYVNSLSPADTEWATGLLPDYSTLTYNAWEVWFGGVGGGGPPATIGRDAVLHLISEDIYLSVKFTSFGGSAGGFSYDRSTLLVPEPSSAFLFLAGSAAIIVFAKRKKILTQTK